MLAQQRDPGPAQDPYIVVLLLGLNNGAVDGRVARQRLHSRRQVTSIGRWQRSGQASPGPPFFSSEIHFQRWKNDLPLETVIFIDHLTAPTTPLEMSFARPYLKCGMQ